MNHFYEISVTNNLQDENTSVTVFRKKEEKWERLLEPFYKPEKKSFPRQESWRNTITISMAVNKPIGDTKICKVTKMEGGKNNGPTKINNFKWEIEITSSKESYNDPNASIEIEIGEKE